MDGEAKKKLGRYHAKRDPAVTNEPFGDERAVETNRGRGTLHGGYVVHLHDATRRHYDVRLEVGGVLWSFAVPRGPSLDPGEKMLAVKTEDHPIEYLEFEDVIPDEQYGAGAMIVWDRGAVDWLEGPAEEELPTGKLHVELRGMKLRGRWAFVKLAKSETGNEWLFFKKSDEHANPARKLVEELPRSVLSGLTVEELATRESVAEKLRTRATKLARRVKLGGAIEALALAPEAGGSRAQSLYDAELDGIRIAALRSGDAVALRTERGEHLEAFYPEIVRALRALPVGAAALDGELVAFDASGRPNRARLAQRAASILSSNAHEAVTKAPVVLVVKDILAWDDADLREAAIESRRAFLSELMPPVGFLRAAAPLEGPEQAILDACASLGIAHVVAKAKGSTYSAMNAARLTTGAPAPSLAPIRHRADAARTDPRNVLVSNRTKVFWPDEGYTKGDLVDYYTAIAGTVGPYLRERPIILVRYPDGVAGKSFYQWNVPVGMPPWVETMALHEDPEVAGPPRSSRAGATEIAERPPKRGFLVNHPSTLVYIANLGCIPLHVLAWRRDHPLAADFLTMDFDVKQSTLAHAITLAQTLRSLLDAIGLPGFPKTSGQTGLHVLVPLGEGQSFETARGLADLLGRLLVERHPDIATMERVVKLRGPRVYVDTGQTGPARAIVAPYSVRAVEGATVSAPLSWDEVEPALDPRAFTIKTMPERIAARGDVLRGLLDAAPDVAGAIAKLARILA